ncbi:MAG TPA: adenosine deaminase [Streptosporangiaceae bacterium]|nr:adenosine deaminase [Streptosporangiaceae bacterium]
MTYPKIELHVHLEGTVRPAALLEIAGRNGVALPAESVEGLARLYQFRDFPHFLEVWMLTTGALRTERDFRQVVTDYAAQAAAHGAVYLEGIFTPAEPAGRGVRWEEIFAGYCDGAQEAWETHGIRVRLTPDIPRGYPMEAADLTVSHAASWADRGVVGIGLGGSERDYPPGPYRPVFARARQAGLGSVPHAGEAKGPASVWEALGALGADRIRHGIRAVEDRALLRELAGRGIVLDVCPISNLRTGVVRSLAEHPLPALLAAGIGCTVNTDDPAMFGTDLGTEHAAAASLGASPQGCYRAGVRGALCDDATRAELAAIGDSFDWAAACGAR